MVSSEQKDQWQSEFVVFFKLFISLLSVSLAAIFIRLSELELGSNATIFNRLWIATAAMIFWRIIQGFKEDTTPDNENEQYFSKTNGEIALLVAMGIVSSISLVLWAWSLTQTTVANSTVIRNLTPIFTTLGGIFIGRVIHRRFFVGMGIAVVGAISLGIGDFEYSTNHVFGDLAALLSAMFYGANLLIVEQLRFKLSSTEIILWRCLLGALLIAPFAILTEDQLFPRSSSVWLSVIALALVCQLLGQGLLIHSLKKVSSAFVAILLLLEPAITALLAWVLFSENLSLINCAGFLIVLVGIYVAKSPA